MHMFKRQFALKDHQLNRFYFDLLQLNQRVNLL
jgi:hypothetical protein